MCLLLFIFLFFVSSCCNRAAQTVVVGPGVLMPAKDSDRYRVKIIPLESGVSLPCVVPISALVIVLTFFFTIVSL